MRRHRLTEPTTKALCHPPPPTTQCIEPISPCQGCTRRQGRGPPSSCGLPACGTKGIGSAQHPPLGAFCVLSALCTHCAQSLYRGDHLTQKFGDVHRKGVVLSRGLVLSHRGANCIVPLIGRCWWEEGDVYAIFVAKLFAVFTGHFGSGETSGRTGCTRSIPKLDSPA